MAEKVAISKEKIIAVANALREKTETAETYTLDEMPGVIGGIQTGADFTISDASNLFAGGARTEAMDSIIPLLKDVTNTDLMFSGCTELTKIPLKDIDTSKVTTMKSMFYNCYALKELDLSNFDTSNATTMYQTFYGCQSLTNLDVTKLDTSKVTDMRSMFAYCQKLKSIDISKFDTSNVTDMTGMFNMCVGLEELDFSGLNTEKVTSMNQLFYNCTGLKRVNLNVNTDNVTNISYMCSSKNLEEFLNFSATNKAGISLQYCFPYGSKTNTARLRRLTFRTDLPEGKYAVRSSFDIKYCDFPREGMVEMFNTLPDVSSLGLAATNTKITITGNPCLTGKMKDGTSCELLTDEDRAIATNKGWTLVE